MENKLEKLENLLNISLNKIESLPNVSIQENKTQELSQSELDDFNFELNIKKDFIKIRNEIYDIIKIAKSMLEELQQEESLLDIPGKKLEAISGLINSLTQNMVSLFEIYSKISKIENDKTRMILKQQEIENKKIKDDNNPQVVNQTLIFQGRLQDIIDQISNKN